MVNKTEFTTNIRSFAYIFNIHDFKNVLDPVKQGEVEAKIDEFFSLLDSNSDGYIFDTEFDMDVDGCVRNMHQPWQWDFTKEDLILRGGAKDENTLPNQTEVFKVVRCGMA